MGENQVKRGSADNIVRKLIPYDAFTIKANTSRANLVRRLSQQTSSKERGGFKGQVHESGFSLQQISPWYISNRLPPSFVGHLSEEVDGTIIKMKILNPFHVGITVLAYLLIGAFFLAALLPFLGTGVQPFPPAAFLVAIGALGMLLLWNWEFWSGVKNSKQQLFLLLGLTEVSEDMGEFLCPACGNPIHENEEKCLKCGWTYKNDQGRE
jgi:hypothetical protein